MLDSCLRPRKHLRALFSVTVTNPGVHDSGGTKVFMSLRPGLLGTGAHRVHSTGCRGLLLDSPLCSPDPCAKPSPTALHRGLRKLYSKGQTAGHDSSCFTARTLLIPVLSV